MYKFVLVATAVGAAVLTTVATPHITFATSGNDHDNKVTICHRTDSATNPYVKITIGTSAAYGGHTEEHAGPIATNLNIAAKLKSQHIKWGDIIPADATHPGENWTIEGKTVYDHDCGCIDKSGPIVGPLSDNDHDSSDQKDNDKGAATSSTTASTSTPAATPSSETVTELPHTGAGSSTLIAGSILSLLAGIAAYGGRFLRARFLPTL